MCQPDTILKIIDAENEGCDAAVIDCMGDPGLKVLENVYRSQLLVLVKQLCIMQAC